MAGHTKKRSTPKSTAQRTNHSSESFLTILDETITRAKKDKKKGAVLAVQIDNVPMIISSYGGEFANQMLEKLCVFLKKSLNKEDYIELNGRDQLNIILYNYKENEIAGAAKEIHQTIQDFFSEKASETPIFLMGSIGSVDFPNNAETAQEALDKAFVALRSISDIGHKYYCSYSDAAQYHMNAKDLMVSASYLQQAVKDGRLRMAYQPIISSSTGETTYHECLLRIVGLDGKISSAGPFIPVAEKMGFIDVIDEFVLRETIQELKDFPDLKLSFNVSNVTVGNKTWLSMAKKLLEDPEIASRAIVELTETAMYENLATVSHFIETLQGLGCEVALDDFGTGFTSFNQLKTLPIDILKIDGSFIRDIVENRDNYLFVKTLLDYTHSYGLKTVAEFVESGQIAKILMAMDVDYFQGNYFCPPLNYRSWAEEEEATAD